MNNLSNNIIIKYLKANLSPARFNHTLGTWRTAQNIASKYKVTPDKIDKAALLHDIGKGLTRKQLITYVKRNKVVVSNLKDIIKYNPWVLHGFVSAAIASKVFKIKDKDILNAIREHTIAGQNMSLLSKILYLADITAPDRRYKGVNKIKWYIKRDIDKAMITALFYKTYHVIKNKKWLHPEAVKAWNSYIEKI